MTLILSGKGGAKSVFFRFTITAGSEVQHIEKIHEIAAMILNFMTDAVIVYDMRANILFMNDAARELTNNSAHNPPGRNISALSKIHGDSIKEDAIAAMQTAGAARQFTISVPKLGQAVSTLHPVSSKNGDISSVVEVISRKWTTDAKVSLTPDSGRLLADLFEVMEDEREHISESFEDFAQTMSAIKFRIEQVSYWLEQSGLQQAKSELNLVLPLLQRTIKELVDLQEFLYPSQLKELGLSPTLQMFFRKLKERFRHIRFATVIEVRELEWSYALKLTLYRVLQDIVNVLAYRNLAREIEVDLRQDDGHIDLTVRKKSCHGEEIEPATKMPPTSFHSLDLIQKRVELARGTLSVSRSSEHDLIIQVKWPLSTD